MFFLHFVLRKGDELPDLASGRISEVDQNVRMDVGDLRIANTRSFQSALINQSPCTDAFDFLEYRAGARMPIEPWMLAATPAQIFLHDPMQYGRITFL